MIKSLISYFSRRYCKPVPPWAPREHFAARAITSWRRCTWAMRENRFTIIRKMFCIWILCWRHSAKINAKSGSWWHIASIVSTGSRTCPSTSTRCWRSPSWWETITPIRRSWAQRTQWLMASAAKARNSRNSLLLVYPWQPSCKISSNSKFSRVFWGKWSRR